MTRIVAPDAVQLSFPTVDAGLSLERVYGGHAGWSEYTAIWARHYTRSRGAVGRQFHHLVRLLHKEVRPMKVFKEFTFEAAHSLPHMPDGHKCKRLHGHSYKVKITVEGVENAHTGIVVDYADITKRFNEKVFNRLDHRNLNDVLGDKSTSERLARWIWREMSGLPISEVEVRETPTAGAIYNGRDE